MLVQQFLETNARQSPDKTALVFGERRYSYGELDAMANRLAHALRDRGVRRGDRVVVYLDNRPETVVALFAILKADAIFVVANRAVKERKLASIVRNCGAAAMIADYRAICASPALFGEFRSSLKLLIATDYPLDAAAMHASTSRWEAVQEAFPSAAPAMANTEDDLAALIYTSGTTGEPKGVMADHAAMIFGARAIVSYLEHHAQDVILCVLPLSHNYGLYQILTAFSCGATVVLEASFAFPHQTLKRIEKERVTGFPCVPIMIAQLLQMDLAGYDLSSLRYMTNAAAALPPRHVRELRTALPGVALYPMYGMTETVRTLYLPPQWIDSKPGSVGVALPGTEVWIEDETGMRVGPGVVGELVVRGRNVMRGYWEAPAETALRFRAGRTADERLCYTGDLFRSDADGCMYFVGRKDDLIKCRGEKIVPKEIEDVLHELAGVTEAVVLGVPDPAVGQAVKAVLVRSDLALTESDVRAHCKRNLEDFMVPTIVEFRESVPRSPSGKVRREELL